MAQSLEEEVAAHLNAGFRLIIASETPLKIGEVISGFGDDGSAANPRFIRQRFAVLRETTYEEWQANIREQYRGLQKKRDADKRCIRFYELDTD